MLTPDSRVPRGARSAMPDQEEGRPSPLCSLYLAAPWRVKEVSERGHVKDRCGTGDGEERRARQVYGMCDEDDLFRWGKCIEYSIALRILHQIEEEG